MLPKPSPAFRRGLLAGTVFAALALVTLEKSTLAELLVSPLLMADGNGPADAIVVAGAGVTGPCEANLSALRRTIKAADLYLAGRAPVVVFTGGKPDGLHCAVADVMAELARRLGVPASRILTEATSRSTRENAFYASVLLDGIQARRVLLVTDSPHMRRASGSFTAYGFNVQRASVPIYATHLGRIDLLGHAVREIVALTYYATRGWLDDEATPRVIQNGAEERPMPHAKPELRQDTRPIVILGASYALGWSLDAVGGSPIINASVAGQTSTEVAARFDADVLAHRPRAVVLWGIINDIFRAPRADIAVATTQTRNTVMRLITRARAAGIEPVLATEVTITHKNTWRAQAESVVGRLLGKSSYHDYVNGHVTSTNRWLRDVARDQRLLLLDFEQVLSKPDGTRRLEFAQEDGSHLSDAAYDALSRYSRPLLERNLNPTD